MDLKLIFAITCLLLLSSCLELSQFDTRPYTAVYFTNNTQQNLVVSIESNTPSSFWIQHIESIEPYESKKLITIDRGVGTLSSDNRFMINLTNINGESFSLIQEITNSIEPITLKFGIEAEDINPALVNQSGYYRYQSSYNSDRSLPTEISFTTSPKAIYQDLHYTAISTPSPKIESDNTDSLSILTYNVWGLPFIARDIRRRFKLIPDYIKHYDVIVLQEVFDASRIQLLNTLFEHYPYQTAVLDGPIQNIFNGGVVIISKYPIVNEEEDVFNACNGSDCFANKGVKYAEIIKKGESYHIFSAHTASFDSEDSRDNRRQQFQQIHQFMESLDIPIEDRVIYAGDFNVNKNKFPGDYADMLAYLRAGEPLYSGYTQSTFDTDINPFARQTANAPQYLDYILLSQQHGHYQSIENHVFIPRSSDEKLWGLWDLSDHFPVSSQIQ